MSNQPAIGVSVWIRKLAINSRFIAECSKYATDYYYYDDDIAQHSATGVNFLHVRIII